MPITPDQLWTKEMALLGLGIPVWHADPHDDYEGRIEVGDSIDLV
jgi:hypothetical protein